MVMWTVTKKKHVGASEVFLNQPVSYRSKCSSRDYQRNYLILMQRMNPFEEIEENSEKQEVFLAENGIVLLQQDSFLYRIYLL